MVDMEKRLLAASPPLFGRGLSFLCGRFQWKKFPFLLTSLTRSTLRSILLVKCHPNALFFSIQRYSKYLAFQHFSRTYFKPTKTFQYTHFSSCQSFITKKRFIKGEALRLLRTNSVKEIFFKYKRDFEQSLCNRGYPTELVHKILTEVQFSDRTEALRNKTKKAKEMQARKEPENIQIWRKNIIFSEVLDGKPSPIYQIYQR